MDKKDLNQQEHEPAAGSVNKGRGLYKNLNISVRTLNMVIVFGILAIILLVLIAPREKGFTITYNSRGGTDVAEQIYEFQENIKLPEPPTREGYTFTGWYYEQACLNKVKDDDKIEQSRELYAGWEEN